MYEAAALAASVICDGTQVLGGPLRLRVEVLLLHMPRYPLYSSPTPPNNRSSGSERGLVAATTRHSLPMPPMYNAPQGW
jgi:hypothetical protein